MSLALTRPALHHHRARPHLRLRLVLHLFAPVQLLPQLLDLAGQLLVACLPCSRHVGDACPEAGALRLQSVLLLTLSLQGITCVQNASHPVDNKSVSEQCVYQLKVG